MNLSTKITFLFISSFLELACSTASKVQHNTTSTRRIKFSQVAELQFGKPASAQLTPLFGKADFLRVVDENEVDWLYKEYEEQAQPTEFLIDKKSGALTGALWFPREKDSLSRKENILKLFGDAHFTSKVAGEITPDYISNDLVYSDPKVGIAFDVLSTTNLVGSISISIPEKKH